jgi:hypothetical protein
MFWELVVTNLKIIFILYPCFERIIGGSLGLYDKEKDMLELLRSQSPVTSLDVSGHNNVADKLSI